MAYKTEQEAFWAGEFGNAYILRNQGKAALAAKTAMFARIVSPGGGNCLLFRAWRKHRIESQSLENRIAQTANGSR